MTLKTWPNTASPTGTVMPRPVFLTVAPAGQAVGRFEAYAADPALAYLLGDLRRDEHLGPVDDEADLDRHVDLGQGVRRELDVEDRPCDRDDAAVLEVLGLGGLGGNGGHTVCSSVAWG